MLEYGILGIIGFILVCVGLGSLTVLGIIQRVKEYKRGKNG